MPMAGIIKFVAGRHSGAPISAWQMALRRRRMLSSGIKLPARQHSPFIKMGGARRHKEKPVENHGKAS